MTGLKKTLGKSYKNLRNAKIGFEKLTYENLRKI